MAEMRMDNARDPEQLRRMEALAQKGKCHFCGSPGEIREKHTAPMIYRGHYCYIVGNDFPYPGSVHHYLIVSRPHVTKLSELSNPAKLEIFSAIEWLERHLNTSGMSVFVRSGNMAYTGATLDHLHFHFLVGAEKTEEMTEADRLLVTLGYTKK